MAGVVMSVAGTMALPKNASREMVEALNKRYGDSMIIAHRPDVNGVFLSPFSGRGPMPSCAELEGVVQGSSVQYGRADPPRRWWEETPRDKPAETERFSGSPNAQGLCLRMSGTSTAFSITSIWKDVVHHPRIPTAVVGYLLLPRELAARKNVACDGEQHPVAPLFGSEDFVPVPGRATPTGSPLAALPPWRAPHRRHTCRRRCGRAGTCSRIDPPAVQNGSYSHHRLARADRVLYTSFMDCVQNDERSREYETIKRVSSAYGCWDRWFGMGGRYSCPLRHGGHCRPNRPPQRGQHRHR